MSVTVVKCRSPHTYYRWTPGFSTRTCSFLLYVADVIELIKECGLIPHAFADDLQIYGHSVSVDTQELVARMTICIERVRCWMASNPFSS